MQGPREDVVFEIVVGTPRAGACRDQAVQVHRRRMRDEVQFAGTNARTTPVSSDFYFPRLVSDFARAARQQPLQHGGIAEWQQEVLRERIDKAVQTQWQEDQV